MKNQKRYNLHYKLRKKGNKVLARQRTVIKRERDLTNIEEKYLSQLLKIDYCIQNPLF